MKEERDWTDGGRRSVKVRKEHLGTLAEMILQKKKEKPSWIEWDEEHWHYQGENFQGTEDLRRERVALYILALDAINFCFWPNRNFPTETHVNSLEYDHLAIALKKLAEADDQSCTDDLSSYFFSAEQLASTTVASMKSHLEPHLTGHYLDNMEKRSELWREVGDVLLTHFDGSAMRMIASAGGNAPKLVELIFTHFPGFRDETLLDGESNRIVFLKRAQIFVGDVDAALKLNLNELNRLTTFADYRVPQILRQYGILEYSPELSEIVDSGKQISKGSPDEVSIRAATVVGVEELVAVLNERDEITETGQPFTDVNVDWYLWQVGEKMHSDGLLKPFHKVRTQFY
jgi:Potential Queuosine, Q, salvage protein family